MIDVTDEETMVEVESLILLCRKIIQAYRIRLRFLGRREILLKSINSKFENIKHSGEVKVGKEKVEKDGTVKKSTLMEGEEAFYYTLDKTLKDEKKLLDIIRGEEQNVVVHIERIIITLNNYITKLGKTNIDGTIRGPVWENIEGKRVVTSNVRGTKDLKNITIYSARIRWFLKQMIKFIELFKEDFRKVERRIIQEEKFLEKANRNEKYFKYFIECWKEEVNSNKKLMKHFDKVIKKNPKVVNNLKPIDYKMIGAVGGVAISVGIAKIASSMDPGTPKIIVFGVAAVGALGAMIVVLRSFSRPELLKLQKDKKILKHIKKIIKRKPKTYKN